MLWLFIVAGELVENAIGDFDVLQSFLRRDVANGICRY